MRLTYHYLLFFLLITTNLLYAQEVILQGKVTDIKSKEPLSFANISTILENKIKGVQTDIDGNYQLNLPVGEYLLLFSFIGYNSKDTTISFENGGVVELDIALLAKNALLEQVVISATKYEQKLGEQTVSLEVLQPALIEQNNTIEVDDALDKVPGVSMIDGQANIRGGSGYSYGAGSRVMLLVDDMPMLTGDGGFPNWDLMPVENIAQVEVIKGASSALYGSAALNGIINIRTAYPTDRPYTKISTFGGIYQNPRNNEIVVTDENGTITDTIKKAWWGNKQPFETGASFTHRQKFGQLDLVVGGYALYQDSWRQEEFDRKIRLNANTRYRFKKLPLKIGVNVNAQRRRSGTFFIWNGLNDGYYQPWFAVNTPIDNALKISIDPFASFWQKEKGIRHKLQGRWYRHDTQNDVNQSVFSNTFFGEYQFQKRFDDLALTLTTGVVNSYVKTKSELYGDSTFTAANTGIYLQADKKFFDKLNVSVGGRYERNRVTDEKEAKPVFRIGANYQAKEYTFVRASFGQGYRFPTIAEKFVATSIGTLGIISNPALESETGWSAEIGVKQGVKISNWQGMLDISGFINEYDNMTEFVFGLTPQGLGFQSQNVGDTRIIGTDISLGGQGNLFGLPTNVLIGYTYINPTFRTPIDSLPPGAIPSGPNITAEDNTLKYRFKHTFKSDVQTNYKQFGVGLSVKYNSFMEAIDKAFELFLPDLDTYRIENAHGNWIVDVRTQYQATERVEVAFLCKNLFNSEYTIRPARIEAPRNYTLKLSYTIK